jgi:hypothetical protein
VLGQAGAGQSCLSLNARVRVGCFDINDLGNDRIRGPGVSCASSA